MQTWHELLSPSGKACGALLSQAGPIVHEVRRRRYHVDMRIVMAGDRFWTCGVLALKFLALPEQTGKNQRSVVSIASGV
jgi:hypothetical protein